MPANSPVRRLIKRVLSPIAPQPVYSWVQSLSMSRDIRTGEYSEPELDLIAPAVREGETVIDMGANFGLYTYHLSRAVGSSGKVYAFEPIPYTCATLRRVALRLGIHNAEIVAKGCGERAGQVTFSVPLAESGAFSAGQAHIGRRDDDRPGKETQVRWTKSRDFVCDVVALDEVLPELTEVSLIKCDIEGAELWAFRGAERLITKHLPSVICEINPWFLDGFGYRLEELTGLFFEKDYELYRYGERDDLLHRITDLKEVIEDNYVFIHPKRLERFRSLLPQVRRDNRAVESPR